jgi:ribonuclease E
VPLPSGGAIVVDHTEALVAVDVNSARATRGSDIEETAFRTNVEAAEEVGRQLRLRDLGGLIVIDFIDMESTKNQREVEQRLRDALHFDRARVQMGKISRFGLMELSRQRLRPALNEGSHITCPRCNGIGVIRDVDSSALHILRILQEEAMKEGTAAMHVQVPVEVATFLLNEKRADIAKLEVRLKVTVVLIPNKHLETPNYSIERLKHDDPRLEDSRASYALADEPAAETPYQQQKTEQAAAKPRQEAVVKGITPSHPAPVSSRPVKATEQEKSFFAKIMSWFSSGDQKSENESADKTRNGDRGDRNDRNRGNGQRDRQSRGSRPDGRSDNRERGGDRSQSQRGRGGKDTRDDTKETRDAQPRPETGEAREPRTRNDRPDRRPRQERGDRAAERPVPEAVLAGTPLVEGAEITPPPGAEEGAGRKRRRRGRGGSGRREESAANGSAEGSNTQIELIGQAPQQLGTESPESPAEQAAVHTTQPAVTQANVASAAPAEQVAPLLAAAPVTPSVTAQAAPVENSTPVPSRIPVPAPVAMAPLAAAPAAPVSSAAPAAMAPSAPIAVPTPAPAAAITPARVEPPVVVKLSEEGLKETLNQVGLQWVQTDPNKAPVEAIAEPPPKLGRTPRKNTDTTAQEPLVMVETRHNNP